MATRYSGTLKITIAAPKRQSYFDIHRVTISRGGKSVWAGDLSHRASLRKMEPEDYDALAKSALRVAADETSLAGVRMSGSGGYYITRKAPTTRSNGVKARKRPEARKAAPKRASRTNGKARKAPRSAAQKRATAKLVARNKARARRR